MAPLIFLHGHCPTLALGIIGRRWLYEKHLGRSIGHPGSWLFVGKVGGRWWRCDEGIGSGRKQETERFGNSGMKESGAV
jgi:hypothetical protein